MMEVIQKKREENRTTAQEMLSCWVKHDCFKYTYNLLLSYTVPNWMPSHRHRTVHSTSTYTLRFAFLFFPTERRKTPFCCANICTLLKTTFRKDGWDWERNETEQGMTMRRRRRRKKVETDFPVPSPIKCSEHYFFFVCPFVFSWIPIIHYTAHTIRIIHECLSKTKSSDLITYLRYFDFITPRNATRKASIANYSTKHMSRTKQNAPVCEYFQCLIVHMNGDFCIENHTRAYTLLRRTRHNTTQLFVTAFLIEKRDSLLSNNSWIFEIENFYCICYLAAIDDTCTCVSVRHILGDLSFPIEHNRLHCLRSNEFANQLTAHLQNWSLWHFRSPSSALSLSLSMFLCWVDEWVGLAACATFSHVNIYHLHYNNKKAF